jgi:hypothetical protein
VGFLDRFRRLVVHTSPLIGDVLPELPSRIPSQYLDARTHALRALRDYVCALEFHREPERGGQPIPFKVLPQNFHVDAPDDVSFIDFSAGTVTCDPGGQFGYEALNVFYEETFGVFGPNTVLQVVGTYREKFNLEYRCALVQQRVAWKAGIEEAMYPDEDVWLLRLKLPQYFGQVCSFDFQDGTIADTPDEGKRRRSVSIGLDLYVNIVRLVHARRLVPRADVQVDLDEATGQPIPFTQTNAND